MAKKSKKSKNFKKIWKWIARNIWKSIAVITNIIAIVVFIFTIIDIRKENIELKIRVDDLQVELEGFKISYRTLLSRLVEEGKANIEELDPLPLEEVTIVETQVQGLEVISPAGTVSRGSEASITIKTAPDVECTITVYYASGKSKASGLEPKYSDSNGNCTWSWMVGSNTTPGDYKIVVTAGGVVTEGSSFTVTK